MALANVPGPDPVKKKRLWGYFALATVILLFGLIRIRLLHFPLERDEGEYAYGGQLILRGIVPYQLCYTMKFPGTAAAYALIEAALGSSGTGIHLGLLLVNSATIVLVFLLGKRLFGSFGGVVAGATYGLLSAGPAVLGFSAHATQFVVLPALGGTLLLLRAKESGGAGLFFWSGLLLGLAPLMKQPGAFFVLFGIFWAAFPRWEGERNTNGAGRTLPLPNRALAKAAPANCSSAFRRDCPIRVDVRHPAQGGTVSKILVLDFLLCARIWGNHSVVARPAQCLGDEPGCGSRSSFDLAGGSTEPDPVVVGPKHRRQVVFLGSFSIFSFAAVVLGFHARNHYFVLVLPATALLCAGAVSAATHLLLQLGASRKWAVLPVAVFFCCFVLSLLQKREFFFVGDPVQLCRKIHGPNPFPEALQISQFIKDHSGTGDRVAVIGSEPEIYFESERLSATGYMYTYPLMEVQPLASIMQKEMISEGEAGQPRFLVYVDCWPSWLSSENSDKAIFNWVDTYVRNRYQLVGIVDELQQGTEYHWGDAGTYQPRSKNRLFVYELNTDRRR